MTIYRASLTSVIQEGHVCVHGCWGKFAQVEQCGLTRLCLRQWLQTHQFALGGLGIQAALQELLPFQGFFSSGKSFSCEAPTLNSRAWVPIEECKKWKSSVVYQLLICGEKKCPAYEFKCLSTCRRKKQNPTHSIYLNKY